MLYRVDVEQLQYVVNCCRWKFFPDNRCTCIWFIFYACFIYIFPWANFFIWVSVAGIKVSIVQYFVLYLIWPKFFFKTQHTEEFVIFSYLKVSDIILEPALTHPNKTCLHWRYSPAWIQWTNLNYDHKCCFRDRTLTNFKIKKPGTKFKHVSHVP